MPKSSNSVERVGMSRLERRQRASQTSRSEAVSYYSDALREARAMTRVSRKSFPGLHMVTPRG